MDEQNLRDRLELIDDRIAHETSERDALAERVLALESDKEVKKARTLEWIVVVLIVIEIVEGIPLWNYLHHG
jgi:uncharacterized Rmd1/YagE family protein